MLITKSRRALPATVRLAMLLLLLPLSALAQDNGDWMDADTIAEPVTLMKELLVTPDGSAPATYILDNVYRRSIANRKRLDYTAQAHVDVVVRDADIIPMVMPRTLMLAAQMYLRTKGLWALFDYATSRPSAQATLRTRHTCKHGKVKYSEGRILQAPADMKKKIGSQLLAMCEFDLFDELYGEKTLVNPDYRRKFAITYEGSFDENGKTIFILKARRYHGELHETQTLHVVDREWGIRRAEYNTRIFRSFRECMPIQDGIYMPHRKVDNPVQFNLEKAIQKGRELLDKKKKVRRMESKTLKRAEKLAEGTRDYRPMVKIGYQITYQ